MKAQWRTGARARPSTGGRGGGAAEGRGGAHGRQRRRGGGGAAASSAAREASAARAAARALGAGRLLECWVTYGCEDTATAGAGGVVAGQIQASPAAAASSPGNGGVDPGGGGSFCATWEAGSSSYLCESVREPCKIGLGIGPSLFVGPGRIPNVSLQNRVRYCTLKTDLHPEKLLLITYRQVYD